jgi:hypothetical protein
MQNFIFSLGLLIYWNGISGHAFLTGKLIYYLSLRVCARVILEHYDAEDRMKMELANMYGLLKFGSPFSIRSLG